MPEDMPDRMPEDVPDRMPEDMSDRMPEDLPVTKCINVMVGITRSKVILLVFVYIYIIYIYIIICMHILPQTYFTLCDPHGVKNML